MTSRQDNRGSMLKAVTGSVGEDAGAVEPLFLDEATQPEPEYPIEQTVSW